MSTLLRWRLRLRPLPSATLGAAATALGLLLCGPAHAQTAASPQTPASTQTPGTSSTFGGFSKNSGEPIDIESDVLVVHDAKKYATFKGNVKAVQGTSTLRSKELDVHYVGGGSDSLTSAPGATGATANADAKGGDPKAGGGTGLGDGTQISKIEARGEVIITNDQDQTTTSDWALYDVPAQLVTVGGNVVLTQGKNVLKGDRLIIDLKTGESRFENPGNAVAPSRIRALFMPKDAKPGDDKKANDKKANDKTANDKSNQSGNESSDNAKAAEKAQNSAEPPANSETWRLLPGQQP